MDTRTLGQRLVAAVVPSRFANLRHLAHALGASYSTVHAWQRPKEPVTPKWEQVEAVAALVGRDAIDLLAGTAPRPTLAEHPQWAEASSAAARRWPERVTPAALAAIASLSLARLPPTLDEVAVLELATVVSRYLVSDSAA